MPTYNVLQTGSKGNATLIENTVLIDCGVSFRRLKPYVLDIQIVLLTHIHNDHFLHTTIERLAKERPTVRFATPTWLLKDVLACKVNKSQIDIIEIDTIYKYGLFTIQAFSLIHNEPNCGYKVHFSNGKKYIYATDTNRIDHIKAKGYDLYMIEANYLEDDLVDRVKDKLSNNDFIYEYDVLENHLSEEKALDWLYQNMESHSQYILMHQHE